MIGVARFTGTKQQQQLSGSRRVVCVCVGGKRRENK